MPLAALEMEPPEEEDFRPLVANGNRKRSTNGHYGNNNDRNVISSTSRRLTPKNVAMILAVTFIGLVFLLRMDFTVTTVDDARTSQVVSKKQRNPHSGSSFGGLNNVAQPAGAKAAAEAANNNNNNKEDEDDDGYYYYASLYSKDEIVIPKSNVGHAIPSLNARNLINHWGHYVHDEHRSPYASHLYDRPKEELEQQQTIYEQKMARIRSEWGMWTFKDPSGDAEDRPIADFSSIDYKDLPADEFPPYSWQADEDYVTAFLLEARALVNRMTEGIYAEYGWPLKKKDGTTTLSSEELEKREQAFRIHILDSATNEKELKKEGIAQLSQVAMDGLVRKLLHAMMTNDEFYVVLAGHSAAAGVSKLCVRSLLLYIPFRLF
jgi:hypothetical protein